MTKSAENLPKGQWLGLVRLEAQAKSATKPNQARTSQAELSQAKPSRKAD
jgi:hypothetical protein